MIDGSSIRGALINVVFCPGAHPALDEIGFAGGANCGAMSQLVSCVVYTGSDGTTSSAFAIKSIVTTTPAAGEVQLCSNISIRFGDAITNRDIVILSGYASL